MPACACCSTIGDRLLVVATARVSQVRTPLLPFSTADAASLSCCPTIESLDYSWEAFHPLQCFRSWGGDSSEGEMLEERDENVKYDVTK